MLTNRIRINLFVLSLITVSFIACTVVWQDFTPKEGDFTVSLPCNPSTSNSFQRLNYTSSVTVTTFACEPTFFKKIPYLYVSVAKYSSWSLGKTTWNEEKMFKGFIQGFQNHVKSTVKEERDSEVAGIYAKEFVMTAAEGGDMLIRVFRNKNSVYSLGIYDKPGKDISSDAQSFFDSFVLNEVSE